MTSTVRVGILTGGSRSQPSYNVPLWIFGLSQENCVSEYHQWCKDFQDQVVILSLNDVQEAMSKVMQSKFMEIFPMVPMTSLPPHEVWIQMAKICGGTLMWQKLLFHSLQQHMNQMQDSFTQKPIVFVVPSIQCSKFKECIQKLYFNSNVRVFLPGSLPTQSDIDDALPFGLTTQWKTNLSEDSFENDMSFAQVFQECFAPLLLQQLEKKRIGDFMIQK